MARKEYPMVDAITGNLSTLQNSLGLGNSAKDSNDVLLKIFSTELAQQDPLSPMDNREWIQQLVQFSSFNELSSIHTELQSLREMLGFVQANNLVGREISFTDEDNNTLRGIVEAVSQREGKIFVMVNQREIPLNQVNYITSASSEINE